MQEQRSAVGSLPEVIGFEHGSTSADAGLDQQMFWSSIGDSGQSQLPNFMASPSDTSMRYVNAANHDGPAFSGWDFGETSSRVAHDEASLNDQQTEHGWSAPINVSTGSVLCSEIQRHGSSGTLSMSSVNVNLERDSIEDTNATRLLQNTGSLPLSQGLNMNSELEDEDDCQVLENPHVHKSGGSKNQPISFASSSAFASSSSDPFGVSNGTGGYFIEEGDGRPGYSSDGRRLSCKRKILEGNSEQPSGSGNASYIQHSDSSLWHAIPARPSASDSSDTDAQVESSLSFSMPEQVNPRFGSSVGRVVSENSTLLSNSGAESLRRNFRLRMSGAQCHASLTSNMFSTESDIGNIQMSSSQNSLRQLLQSNPSDVRPASAADNTSYEAQSVVFHVSSMGRNPQSSWNAASGSRSRNSSIHPVSGERTARNVSGYHMFAQPSESRSSLQSAPSWGLAWGSVSSPGNVASASQSGAGAGALAAASSRNPHQSHLQYPHRLSESVRRALLSAADSESGGQSTSNPSLHSGPSASQQVSLPSASARHGRHSHSRSTMLLERHLDGAFEIPYSLRALAAASEGRSRLMSEIRSVLDLVRRGENLQIEDLMILDQSSVFLGMTDIHDRHRDMRLDVDNMSYEELLALEERIGNVSTGLSEEFIVLQLKQRKQVHSNMGEAETEPCCVCQEEYRDGEDVGRLDCGHDFHAECIKQWLMHKNLCPICKTTGLKK